MNLVQISKSEKEIISKEIPDIHIVRTMKQDSKRHKYYCPETRLAMTLLNKIRTDTNA